MTKQSVKAPGPLFHHQPVMCSGMSIAQFDWWLTWLVTHMIGDSHGLPQTWVLLNVHAYHFKPIYKTFVFSGTGVWDSVVSVCSGCLPELQLWLDDTPVAPGETATNPHFSLLHCESWGQVPQKISSPTMDLSSLITLAIIVSFVHAKEEFWA